MLVYGHRGAAGESPENTLASFRHAITRGTKYIELDVRLSKDQQLVVIHDDKVNRTTSQRGYISKYTAAELKRMDARKDGPPWPDKRLTGISTLETVIEKTPEIQGYNIEIKKGDKKTTRNISEIVAELFSSKNSAKKIIVTSSDTTCHEVLMDIAPHIDRGLVSMRQNPFKLLEKYRCNHLSTVWE